MAAQVGIATGIISQIANAFRGSTFTVPAFYIGLHTAIPGGNGTTGVSTGSALREPLVFGPAANNAIAQTGSPPSWVNGGTEGEVISHWSGWTGLAGAFIMSGELEEPITWYTNDSLVLSTLSLPLAPVASS